MSDNRAEALASYVEDHLPPGDVVVVIVISSSHPQPDVTSYSSDIAVLGSGAALDTIGPDAVVHALRASAEEIAEQNGVDDPDAIRVTTVTDQIWDTR